MSEPRCHMCGETRDRCTDNEYCRKIWSAPKGEDLGVVQEMPPIDVSPEDYRRAERLKNMQCLGVEDMQRAYKELAASYYQRERQLSAALTEVANLSSRCESLQAAQTKEVMLHAVTKFELARARELNQDLKQVVKEYREQHQKHVDFRTHPNTQGQIVACMVDCPICIKADALLAPKSESAPKPDTGEEKKNVLG